MHRETDKLRARRGFTLIELIVVIAIMGVIISIGTDAFNNLTTAWNDIRTESDLDRQVDNVFNSFQEDISDTMSARLSGEAISGVRRDTSSEKYFDRVLADDMIVLPVQSAAADTRMRTGSKVSWQVNRGQDRSVLVRGVGSIDQAETTGGTSEELGNSDVIRLAFEFASVSDPATWVREWSAKEHPAAVKMTLVLADRARPWVQVSREAVFPVNVR